MSKLTKVKHPKATRILCGVGEMAHSHEWALSPILFLADKMCQRQSVFDVLLIISICSLYHSPIVWFLLDGIIILISTYHTFEFRVILLLLKSFRGIKKFVVHLHLCRGKWVICVKCATRICYTSNIERKYSQSYTKLSNRSRYDFIFSKKKKK